MQLSNAASLLVYPEPVQTELFVASAVATLAAGVLAMVVVLSTTSRQDSRLRMLLSSSPEAEVGGAVTEIVTAANSSSPVDPGHGHGLEGFS